MGLVALALAVPVLALAVPASVSAEYYLPAGDVVHERIFEVHPVVGWFAADNNASYGDGAGSLGLRGSLNTFGLVGPGTASLALARAEAPRPRGMLNSYDAQPVFNAAGAIVGVVITEMQTAETLKKSTRACSRWADRWCSI